MAGDWIKLECTTPDKPEIVQMAERLGIDQDSVVGKCLRVWIWADQQSTNGNALSVTESFLDRITYCAGFAEAMKEAGWLSSDGNKLELPNFGRHNGQTAKTRALTTKRVEKSRSVKRTCNAASVTESLPEKRREEKSISISVVERSEVIIPEKMQSPDVQQRAALWFAHLDVKAPGKAPPPNSPQLQAFWEDASRLGPERFCEAVLHSTSRGFVNLREPDERRPPAAQKVEFKNGKKLQEL